MVGLFVLLAVFCNIYHGWLICFTSCFCVTCIMVGLFVLLVLFCHMYHGGFFVLLVPLCHMYHGWLLCSTSCLMAHVSWLACLFY